MLRWLRFEYFIPLIFLIGAAQYGGVASTSALQGDSSLWQMDAAAMEGAGYFRYLKDVFLLIFGVAWPLYLSKVKLPTPGLALVHAYFPWMLGVLVMGLIGALVGDCLPVFIIAGIRWLLLLHAGFGAFLLMFGFYERPRKHRSIIRFLIIVAACDLFVVLWQLRSGQAAFGVSFGQGRLTGLFNNAGIAGFFAFGLALMAMSLDGASQLMRLMLSSMALIIALSSGTRSMTIGVFVMVMLQFFEWIEAGRRKTIKQIAMLMFLPAVIGIALVGYGWLISVVDRGDILENQLAAGGRISNLVNMIDILSVADQAEFMFGRGLGVGTNTAYSMLGSAGMAPDQFRFNWLIDNAFLTQFFQFGLLGSIVFWFGIFGFCLKCFPKADRVVRRRYFFSASFLFFVFWAGNPFEHFFLVLPFAVSLGAAYWAGVTKARLVSIARTYPRAAAGSGWSRIRSKSTHGSRTGSR